MIDMLMDNLILNILKCDKNIDYKINQLSYILSKSNINLRIVNNCKVYINDRYYLLPKDNLFEKIIASIKVSS